MIRRLPIIPTIIVLAAAITMVVLGFWQLSRMDEKKALIARYKTASSLSAETEWPSSDEAIEDALYRVTTVDCARVIEMTAKGGRSSKGASGWAHIARCDLAGGGQADIALGYSRDPNPDQWDGGEIRGYIAPSGRSVRLVAMNSPDGLQTLAPPDPSDMPNNHLAYAGQWFFFALTALGIYWLAVRGKARRH